MSQSIAEIKNLIGARYPLVYVVSSEETRVIKSLAEVCNGNLPCVSWRFTKGFVGKVASLQGCQKDPAGALAKLEKTTNAGVFILIDFHPYVKDPGVVRALRDCVEAFRKGASQRTLILLSPVQEIPPELEKVAALVDWALPSREELRVSVQAIAPQVRFDGPVDPIVDALTGLTEMEAENALAKSAVACGTLDATIIRAEKKQIIRKSGLLEYIETNESSDTVGGLDVLKEWSRERRNAFSPEAEAYGLPIPKGLLTVGVSGGGKSLVAKALGNDWGFPLLRLDVGSLFGGLVGQSEQNTRAVQKLAEAMAPCILMIDEIEKGFGGAGGAGDSGTSGRVLGSFLTWMQEKTAPVFVVATANDVSALPPEMLRKGRFDEIFFVDLPSEHERQDILAIHLRKVNRDPADFDVATLAERTSGYTGAELEQIVHSALYTAFSDTSDSTHREPTNADLFQAAEDVTPLSRTAEEKIEALREWAKGRARPASRSQVQTSSGRLTGIVAGGPLN